MDDAAYWAFSKEVWQPIKRMFGLEGRRVKSFTLTLDVDEPATVTLTEFVGPMDEEVTARFRLVPADSGEPPAAAVLAAPGLERLGDADEQPDRQEQPQRDH